MHAISGPKIRASWYSLVRAHQVEIALANLVLYAAGKGPVEPATPAENAAWLVIADDFLETRLGGPFPASGNQHHLRFLGNERGKLTFDKALGTTVRVIAPANDGSLKSSPSSGQL